MINTVYSVLHKLHKMAECVIYCERENLHLYVLQK